MKKTTLSLFATLLLSVCLFSCKYSADSGGTPETTVTPKKGSTYTYNKHEVDSSTSGKTTGDTAVTAIVLASDTTFAGKSHVVILYDNFDTMRYVVESNGDISFYRDGFGSNGFVFNNPTPWLRLPYGSKGTGITLFDTTQEVSYGGNTETVKITGTGDYVGTDKLTVGGKELSGGQAKLTIKISGTTPAVINVTSTQTFSFGKSIGYYFHSISKTVFDDIKLFGTTLLAGTTTSNEKTLTSFELK